MFKRYEDALLSYSEKLTIEIFPGPILIWQDKVTIEDIFQPFSSFYINLVESAKDLIEKKQAEGYKHKILLSGRAGDGKSTFMKRLTVGYIKKDTEFFEEQNDVFYTIMPSKFPPIFIELGHLRYIEAESLEEMSLCEVCFFIAKRSFLKDIEITKGEYEKIFDASRIIVADAYDEILSVEKEKIFREKLRTAYEQKEIVLSCREEKICDFLKDKFENYSMPSYNKEDVRGFVEKYYKICGYGEEHAKAIISNLESSNFHFIKDFIRSPILLTLLLTCIENSGSYYLPTDIKSLFDAITDRFMKIYSNKNREHRFLPETLKIFLRYIAIGLVEWGGTGLLIEEVCEKIKVARKEKEGFFGDFVYDKDPEIIYNELLATGLIVESEGLVSFTNHRLFLEYFAGLGLSDIGLSKTKNFFVANISNMDCSQWKMPYIFFLLDKKKYVYEFVEALIEQINEEDSYSSNEANLFLLDLIVYNVDMDDEMRYKIYDLNFKSIDFIHNTKIYQILALDNITSKEFVGYIESKSKQAFQNQTTDFIDTLAVINLNKNEPFEHMENLFKSGDEFSVWLATKMLTELTRIKIGDTFIAKTTPAREAVNTYIISPDCAEAIVQIYKTNTNDFLLGELSYVLALTCVLEITSFSDLFTDENFAYLVSELNECGKNARYFEILLGVADINKLSYSTSVSEEVKKRFLNEYRQHISGWEINSVYSFVKCVRSGCFTHENYSYVDFRELKSVVAASIYRRLSPDDFPTNNCSQEMLLERIKRDLIFEKVFISNKNTYKAIYKDADFSLSDIERLLFVEGDEKAICNNLSSLLRRGLVLDVTKNGQVVTETYLNANNGDFLSNINESLLKVGLNKEFYDWLHNTNLSEESDLMVGASNYYEKLAAEYSQRIKVFFEKIQEAYEFLLSKKFTLTKEDAFACIYSWSEPKNGERDFEGFVLLTLLWKFDEFIFDEFCVEDKDNFIHIGSLARDFLKSGLASQDVFWGVFSALYTTHLKRYCIDKLLEKDPDDTSEFKLIDGKLYAVIDKLFYKDYDCVLCANNEGEYYFLYYDEVQKKEIVIEDKESLKSVLYDFYENVLE